MKPSFSINLLTTTHYLIIIFKGVCSMRDVTLCLLIKDDSILLGFKKREFAKDAYNGFGGKREFDEATGQYTETILAAAVRELYEETRIIAEESDLKECAVLDFEFFEKPEQNKRMHVYIISGSPLTAVETDEMRPEVFSLNSIPYDKMLPADRYWLPYVLEKKIVTGKFRYSESFELLDVHLDAKPLSC
jgi:8-oxo-dGTP diphosphatase/2-hydroxy-dATP diphosphatase